MTDAAYFIMTGLFPSARRESGFSPAARILSPKGVLYMTSQHTNTSSQLTYMSIELLFKRSPSIGILSKKPMWIVGSGTMPGSENEPFTLNIVRSKNTVIAPANMFNATPIINSSDLRCITNSPKNRPSSMPISTAIKTPISALEKK